MFGLKVFVQVQTFRRGPPVPPHNFCHPGLNRANELHYITPMINMQCVPRSKNTLLLEVLEGRSVVLSPVAISALLRCQLACWYRGIVRTLGDCTWQLRTLRARAHILASRRSHGQGFYTLEADWMLSDHSCWQLIKLKSHFGGDDGLEQLVAYFKNCVRKACKQSCIALYKFKKQRLYFKPYCNQKRNWFFLRPVRPKQALSTIEISSSSPLLRDFIKTIGTIEWLATEWFG